MPILMSPFTTISILGATKQEEFSDLKVKVVAKKSPCLTILVLAFDERSLRGSRCLADHSVDDCKLEAYPVELVVSNADAEPVLHERVDADHVAIPIVYKSGRPGLGA